MSSIEYILGRIKSSKYDHMIWVGSNYSLADLRKDLMLARHNQNKE